MLKRVVKRAALGATVGIGNVQRRLGQRFSGYASFWRRAAGYAAYAMAGEPFVPSPGHRLVLPPGRPPYHPPHMESRHSMTVCIDEPAEEVQCGFFHLRGWLAAERRAVDIHATVNGKHVRLYRYPRPDVEERHPTQATTGFSAFVRLGEIPDPHCISIVIVVDGRPVAECTKDATTVAVEAGRRNEDERRAKREWILPRIACIRCGGDLDAAAKCHSCGTAHDANGFLDCIPLDARGGWDTEFQGAVSAHGYDADVERVIAHAEASGGKVLDCGAGLRPTVRRNVITTDIFPYPTTDALAVNQRLPFKDETFDAVLSLHVLEHVPDPFGCARELCRVLRRGGTLFAVTPMIVPEHGYPHHFFNPTREGLARLFGRAPDGARVFVPAMGHPINGLWTLLAVYRDSLPASQRDAFLSLTVGDIVARPMEDWIGADLARMLSEEGRTRLAANYCIEFVK